MLAAHERQIKERAEAFTEDEMRAVLSVARLDLIFDELYKRIDDLYTFKIEFDALNERASHMHR